MSKVAAVALAWLIPQFAVAALNVELNKLEPRGDACRLYLVFVNDTARDFSAFKLDLVLFGQEGVIAKRLAVDAAPLKARKTSVRLFDLPQIDCAGIARILVNDVLECRVGSQDVSECQSMVTVSSRAEVELLM
jgi:hypothetical protein